MTSIQLEAMGKESCCCFRNKHTRKSLLTIGYIYTGLFSRSSNHKSGKSTSVEFSGFQMILKATKNNNKSDLLHFKVVFSNINSHIQVNREIIRSGLWLVKMTESCVRSESIFVWNKLMFVAQTKMKILVHKQNWPKTNRVALWPLNNQIPKPLTYFIKYTWINSVFVLTCPRAQQLSFYPSPKIIQPLQNCHCVTSVHKENIQILSLGK